MYCSVSLNSTKVEDRYPIWLHGLLVVEGSDPGTTTRKLMMDIYKELARGDKADTELIRAKKEQIRQNLHQRRLPTVPSQHQQDMEAVRKRFLRVLEPGAPLPKRAKDHIQNDVWGGPSIEANLLRNVCENCNGANRGFIPFSYWVNGYGGTIETKPLSGQRYFKPTTQPVINRVELRIRQSSISAGIIDMVLEDQRVPVRLDGIPKIGEAANQKGQGAPHDEPSVDASTPSAPSIVWSQNMTKRSAFVAALPYFIQADPAKPVTSNNIGRRMQYVFGPLVKLNPEFFLSAGFEEYLVSNRRHYEPYVDALLQHVIYPARAHHRDFLLLQPQLTFPPKGHVKK